MAETAKERLVQFIENEGITINQFCIKNNFSNSFFNNKSAIGSDKLLNIFRNYPALNMDWVITGRGEMIVKNGAENNEWREKYYETLEKYNACLEGKNASEPLGKTA